MLMNPKGALAALPCMERTLQDARMSSRRAVCWAKATLVVTFIAAWLLNDLMAAESVKPLMCHSACFPIVLHCNGTQLP